MPNLLKILALMCFIISIPHNAKAQIEFKKEVKIKKEIEATGFVNYPPFGKIEDPRYPDRFQSVFRGVLDEFFKEWNYETSFVVNKKYDTLVREVRRGEIDLLLGAYHETELYTGIELVFPSVLSNPITVIMLPHRINEVQNIQSLTKLKGAVNSTEVFTDYANLELKKFNITRYDNSDKMFEQLFTGKIDYVLSSYYFGLIETSRLGIRKKLSFSKQIIWDMPLFFGVSKLSKHRQHLIKALRKMCENPETKRKVEQALHRAISDIERESVGIVPPSYSMQ